jgi:hypothetical protein
VRQNEEAPRAESDHLDDADDVVDRRVVGALLVTVVQAVHACQQDPQRDGRSEQQDLRDRSDPVGRGGRGDRHGDDVRRHEADDVGEKEQPPHEPSAASPLRPRHVDLMESSIARCDGDRVLR